MKLHPRTLLWLLTAMLGDLHAQGVDFTAQLSASPIQALLPMGNRLWVAQENRLTPWDRTGGIGPALNTTGVGGRNRLMLPDKLRGIFGAAVVGQDRKAETISGLVGLGIVGVCRHPAEQRWCFLTDDGRLLGADLTTNEVAVIFENLPKALGLGSARPRMRAIFAAHDRIYVANDAEPASGGLPGKSSGRLAEWDWRGAWRIVETAPFVEVVGVESGQGERGDVVFALGYDDLSVILRVYAQQQWKRYRLPWRERPLGDAHQRIREVSPQQWIMLGFGNYYTLHPPAPGLTQPRVRPLCSCIEPVRDFCMFGNQLLLAGGNPDQATGTAQPFLRETTLAALAAGPRPTGQGSLWRNTMVAANQVSDSFLIAAFQKRTVHVSNEADTPLTIDVEVDATNTEVYRGLYRLQIPAHSYVPYVFPEGYSGTWLRLRAVEGGVVTAELTLE